MSLKDQIKTEAEAGADTSKIMIFGYAMPKWLFGVIIAVLVLCLLCCVYKVMSGGGQFGGQLGSLGLSSLYGKPLSNTASLSPSLEEFLNMN
jgi:hypothetical protein